MTETSLIVFDSKTNITQQQLAEAFTKEKGLDGILMQIAAAARAEAAQFDGNTEAGRKGLKAVAAQVSKIAKSIAEEGKEIVRDVKARVAIVDRNRIDGDAFLKELRDEIKRPATEYENQQKELKERSEAVLAELRSFAFMVKDGQFLSSAEIQQRIDRLNEIKVTAYDFMQDEIDATVMQMEGVLASNLQAAQDKERQDAELAAKEEALKKAEAAAHDEKIRREAEEKAKQAAAKREAELLAEAEAAKQAAKQAEEEKAKAKAEAEEAAKQAHAKAQAAAQAVTQNKPPVSIENADEETQRRVNNAVVSSLIDAGCTKPVAVKILERIINNEIPHVSIDYSTK